MYCLVQGEDGFFLVPCKSQSFSQMCVGQGVIRCERDRFFEGFDGFIEVALLKPNRSQSDERKMFFFDQGSQSPKDDGGFLVPLSVSEKKGRFQKETLLFKTQLNR